MKGIFICNFEGAPDAATALKAGGYDAFKAAVLKAGRFSCFEATASMKMARAFTRLCRDPEVVTDIRGGYPWTKVRRALNPSDFAGGERR